MNACLREIPVLVVASWVLWLPITFWFGRVYCRWVCPLGLCQSLVQLVCHPRRRVRRVCASLPRSRVQRIVNWVLVAVYFLAPLGYLLNPWGIFGRMVFLLSEVGVLVFAVILLLAAFGRVRLWCNWVCPVGTIFDLFARLGWKRERFVSSCSRCRRCFGK